MKRCLRLNVDSGGFLFYIMCNTKTCNHCKQEKPLEEFCKNKNMSDGYNSRCKTCASEFNKKYRNMVKIIPETKICNCCGVEKTSDNFHKKASSKDGIYHTCKKCRVQKTKEYNDNNKEKRAEAHRKWRINNPNYEGYKNYHRNRRLIDSIFKLRSNISSLVKEAFKGRKTDKSAKTIVILGCTITEFEKHLESQFLNWMNWDNMGNKCNPLEYNCSWDLDHIIPVSYAKTEEDVYRLNHYTNFQPLCSKVNRKDKKNKIPLVCNTFFQDYTENL